MKLLTALLITLLALGKNTFSQSGTDGTKPKISINGVVCAIENQQFSCLTKTCDSITISPGDTVRFCTGANIDLITDTAYYMQWNFTGSSNYPTPLLNKAPSLLPICYAAIWTNPGSYTVDIYHNNWLTAHPGRDCFSYGPSHWQTRVTVQSLSGISDISQNFNVTTFPNPVSDILTIESKTNETFTLKLLSIEGQKIAEKRFSVKTEIDVSMLRTGIYLIEISDLFSMPYLTKKIVLK